MAPDSPRPRGEGVSVRLDRLRRFVGHVSALLSESSDEAQILGVGASLLRALIRHDDWLPEAYARPDPGRYQQYLLHCDSAERFSVVSFVWGPGQETPVHNHTVWGLVGVLRGAEISQRYSLREGRLIAGARERLDVGQVDAVSPTVGDIHKVGNALPDAPSVSIHLYGANIGAVRRAVFDGEGRQKPFISGYANTSLPNLWDQSEA
jgi:predicted metal-dependent enzyme (double-stranded beta helix superfamily)